MLLLPTLVVANKHAPGQPVPSRKADGISAKTQGKGQSANENEGTPEAGQAYSGSDLDTVSGRALPIPG